MRLVCCLLLLCLGCGDSTPPLPPVEITAGDLARHPVCLFDMRVKVSGMVYQTASQSGKTLALLNVGATEPPVWAELEANPPLEAITVLGTARYTLGPNGERQRITIMGAKIVP